MLQIDSAREAADLEVAQQQAAAIATDNADGLGEERCKAVLAEAEAATAGLSRQRALPHPQRITRGAAPCPTYTLGAILTGSHQGRQACLDVQAPSLTAFMQH